MESKNRELASILALINTPEDVEYVTNRIPLATTLGTDNLALWGYYSTWVTNNESCDLDEYDISFKAGILSTVSSAKRAILQRLWSDAVETSAYLVETKNEVVVYHNRYKVALGLAAKLAPLLETASYSDLGSDLDDVLTEATDTLSDLVTATQEEDTRIVTSSLTAMVAARQKEGTTLDWPLEELNISVGPAKSGMLYLITAPVETGKTLAVSDISRYFASQVPPDRPVLWLNL